MKAKRKRNRRPSHTVVKNDKPRPARTSFLLRARTAFRLNKNNVVVIGSVLGLLGLLATGVLANTASVVVATISNWDKLSGGQATQATQEAGDLLAYNEQRRTMVEDSYDRALKQLEAAGGTATGNNAAVIDGLVKKVRADKAVVQGQYDKLIDAIKSKKRVQADISKTELNVTILGTQMEIDQTRSTLQEPNLFVGIVICCTFEKTQRSRPVSWRDLESQFRVVRPDKSGRGRSGEDLVPHLPLIDSGVPVNVGGVAGPVVSGGLLEHPLAVVLLPSVLRDGVEEQSAGPLVDPETLEEHPARVDAVVHGEVRGDIEPDAYVLSRFQPGLAGR